MIKSDLREKYCQDSSINILQSLPLLGTSNKELSLLNESRRGCKCNIKIFYMIE